MKYTHSGNRLNRSLGLFLLSLSIFLTSSYAADTPHNYDCSSCHDIHSAQGGSFGEYSTDVALCQSCHMPGGDAERFSLGSADMADPGFSGTSHGFNVNSVNPIYSATKPMNLEMRQRLEYNPSFPDSAVVCATCHNQHSQEEVPFLRVEADSICQDCHPSRWIEDGDSTHPVMVSLPSDSLYQEPPGLWLYGGVITCETCHSAHYGYSTQSIKGIAELGSFISLTDNDANWSTDQFVGWEVWILDRTGVDTLKWFQYRIVNSNSNNTLYWGTDSLSYPVELGDTFLIKESGSGDGYLLQVGMQGLCSQCHKFSDGIHLSATSGALWPGGQYGSNYARVNGVAVLPQGRTEGSLYQALPEVYRGNCINCHWPHGWIDETGEHYSSLTVDKEENLCFTCHDTDGPADSDIYIRFAPDIRWVTIPAGPYYNPNLNDRHDVQDTAQSKSGVKLECSDCHNPHATSGDFPLIADPDTTDGRVPAPGQTWSGSDSLSEWCLDCHDGSFPPTVTPPTMPLTDIRYSYTHYDIHGTSNAIHVRLKDGYGWQWGDVLSCSACHTRHHVSLKQNLFQLVDTVYSKDGNTPIPSDDIGFDYEVTNNNIRDGSINGYQFCNTCHTNSMGGHKRNCFEQDECHSHGVLGIF